MVWAMHFALLPSPNKGGKSSFAPLIILKFETKLSGVHSTFAPWATKSAHSVAFLKVRQGFSLKYTSFLEAATVRQGNYRPFRPSQDFGM